jgi:hypothetical protein
MSKPYQSFRRSNFGASLPKFFKELGTPLATSIESALSNGESGARFIVGLECHPSNYVDLASFQCDYVAVNLLKKCKFLRTGIDTEQVARENLENCEQLNQRTNERFRSFSSDPNYRGQIASILSVASRKIEFVLGEFDIDEMLGGCRWGPGSTTTVSYGVATAEEKFRAARGATPQALELFGPVFQRAFPAWSDTIRCWEYCAGNRVTFVDKNARTKRSIAKEPDFNLWFQLAVGAMIRRCLKKVGIDLNTQANNQTAARIGSITNQIATVDIKDASNSLAFELVRHLVLNNDWFRVLDSLRSHYGTDGDTTKKWEMFSSMGNGFTFELETLIFWALTAASCEVCDLDPCVRVFGDDIACPPEVVPVIEKVFEYCGFRLNAEKSFAEGPFRESCGVHYWTGIDCQPLYLKEEVTTASEAFRLANSLRRMTQRLKNPQVIAASIRFHRSLVLGVPSKIRFGVPESLGDAGFWVNPSDEIVLTGLIEPVVDLSHYHEFGWEGFHVSGLREKTRYTEVNHVGVLLARLHGMSSTGDVLKDAARDSQGVGKGNLQYLREPGVAKKATFWTREWKAPLLQGGF